MRSGGRHFKSITKTVCCRTIFGLVLLPSHPSSCLFLFVEQSDRGSDDTVQTELAQVPPGALSGLKPIVVSDPDTYVSIEKTEIGENLFLLTYCGSISVHAIQKKGQESARVDSHCHSKDCLPPNADICMARSLSSTTFLIHRIEPKATCAGSVESCGKKYYA
jgi:hypothetical protein